MSIPNPVPVVPADLPEIRQLMAAAIRQSVARTPAEAEFLVTDVGASLDAWQAHPGDCLHLKHVEAGRILGVALVKDYRNLTNLFVNPSHHGRGIGRNLMDHLLPACRTRSPRGAVLVNSSHNAVGFYLRMGFRQTGPGRDRPGGCIPLRFDFPGPQPGP